MWEWGSVEGYKQNKIGHMSIIVENEKCMKVQHTLPLGMNEIFHNQVTYDTQCKQLFLKNHKDNAKLYCRKYFRAFPTELFFVYLKLMTYDPLI